MSKEFSSFNVWIFEGKKFKFLGSLNFGLHCVKWVISRK